MANLDFYATRKDQINLLDFIFSKTNFRVFQSYSDYDKELVEYKSTQEIDQKYNLGYDKFGNGLHCTFQLWSPTIMEELEVRKISLNNDTGYMFRYRMEGFALVQLYLGGVNENIITKSHIGSNSESRARTWGYTAGVNWENHKKEINMICNYIRRDSKIKAGSRILMQEAFQHAKEYYHLKDYKAAPWHYELKEDGSFELIRTFIGS